MEVTLNLNPTPAKTILLDTSSEQWLRVVHESSGKQRPCAIPARYFEILQTWGLVDGSPDSAKITARGNTRFVVEAAQAKSDKKSKTKNK